MFRSVLFASIAIVACAAQQDAPATPNFRDLTIKTRVTRGLGTPMIKILWLKGARERSEERADSPNISSSVVARITQCDQQTHIMLFDYQKTYRKDHFRVSARPSTFVARAFGPVSGPPVTVIFESVDTDERKMMGSYEARRIKTTITVEPGKGATTPKGKTKVDGWYLEIPGLHCDQPPDWPPFSFAGWHVPMTSGNRDRITFKYEGGIPLGYPVEETSTEKTGGNVIVNKTELVEISDAPLQDSLFDVPTDYSPAPDLMRSGMTGISAAPPHAQ